MAARTTYLPRFLLPQYGPMWPTAARARALTRPPATDSRPGLLLVRYASKATATKASAASAPTKPPGRSTRAAIKQAAAATSPNIPTKTEAAVKAAIPKASSAPPKPDSTKPAAPVAAKAEKPAGQAASAAPPPAADAAQKPADQAASAPSSPPPPPPPPTPAPEPAAQRVAPTTTSAATASASITPPKPAAAAAAAKKPKGPIVLEKPDKFRPPSHGRRLPKGPPRHYGGPLTQEESKVQATKHYPGLPPPKKSWTHWLLHNRSLHTWITMGLLGGLALYTFALNAQRSPFYELVPPIRELARHPFEYVGICLDCLRLHEERESAITGERRRRKVEDVAKRDAYLREHGVEPPRSFFAPKPQAVVPRPEAPEPEPEPEPEPAAPASVVVSPESQTDAAAAAVPVPAATEIAPEDGKRKKFLGIF
ncbi:hypothetical protein GGR56DRAFT_17906 [Xylariaceae sp. FL0804]|nr:hypothetical protein GGR56DRAFT_17906 [Xylariaceae sp. FL0804]